MPVRSASTKGGREPLDRERVIRAAVKLADAQGIGALTMRRLAQLLGVEAMSLYNHFANKDDLLEGVADLITSEFELPSLEADWKATLRRSAISAHEALLRHPWASGLIESRPTLGPARMRYVDAIIGVHQVVGDHADQAERTCMIELVEEIGANGVEPLGDVGRFAEPALTAQDLKVDGLELYAHAEGHVALLSETPTDRLC